MRKKIFSGIAVLAIAAVAVWNVSLNSQKDVVSSLTLEQLCADAGIFDGIEEWWNRNDYDCISVVCLIGIVEKPATQSQYMGEGKGSVAHSWECGCIGYPALPS